MVAPGCTRDGLLGSPRTRRSQASKCGRTCFFRDVEADEKPSKKSKKGVAKASVALLKESTQLGCVSQDSHPRKSILRERGKIGIKTRRQILQRHLAQIKIRERKGPWRGIIPKM